MSQSDTLDNNNRASGHCITCNSPLNGEYCYKCGEKTVSDKDYSLKNLLEQALDSFTHLDSKFFKSFYLLLFNPGYLSSAFIKGNRKPFMKPFQIFLICNIIFFIFLSNTDVFRKPSSWWQHIEREWTFSVAQTFKEKSISKNIPQNELAEIYDHQSTTLSKGLIVLFVPFITLLLSTLQYKNKMPFGKHLIFSVHLFSFYLLIMVFWNGIVSLLPVRIFWGTWLIPIEIIFATYFTIAFKKFYHLTWWWTIAKSLLCILAIYFVTGMYRSLISIITLNYI